MATKKKKPVSAEFNTLNVEQAAEASAESGSESDKIIEKAGIVEVSITDEIKSKLDAYEKLAEENAKYAQEISNLQDQLAKYIQEIQDLKKNETADRETADNRLAELESENSRLSAQLNVMQAASQRPAESKQKRNFRPNPYRRRIIDGYQSWN